ncbi:MAG: YciI family protein [Hyphomicrobiales bacterium]
MDYSILIYGTEGTYDRLPQEQQEEVMAGHIALQEALREKGAFGSARLMPTSNAVTLKATSEIGQKPTIMDGPFAETKERFLGFYVADFDSLEEAISFAEHIVSPYVTLEIRPVAWAGGTLGGPPK